MYTNVKYASYNVAKVERKYEDESESMESINEDLWQGIRNLRIFKLALVFSKCEEE